MDWRKGLVLVILCGLINIWKNPFQGAILEKKKMWTKKEKIDEKGLIYVQEKLDVKAMEVSPQRSKFLINWICLPFSEPSFFLSFTSCMNRFDESKNSRGIADPVTVGPLTVASGLGTHMLASGCLTIWVTASCATICLTTKIAGVFLGKILACQLFNGQGAIRIKEPV